MLQSLGHRADHALHFSAVSRQGSLHSRSAAADMAMKLASMWGLGAEGSEDGDEAAAARTDGQQQLDVRK